MKPSFSISSSFSLLILLSVSISISSVSSESAVSQVLYKFLLCLPNYATPNISSAIFTPQNSSFLSVLHAYSKNLRFQRPETHKPLAIITALHLTHAQATVICARPLGLQLRIRSGGHDYEGISYRSDVPFVVLDLFNLRSIDVYRDRNDTPTTVRVEAGATVGELYYRIAQESPVHAVPAGVCPTLGVGGHFSGGGYGNLMRKYGLSVDNIIDAEFIDVNGVLHNRETMGEDVFWAIRGGGAASFGVVISWVMNLVPVPETVTVFDVKMIADEEASAIDVAHRWQYVAPNLPKELFIRAMHEVVESSKSEGEFTVAVSFIGLFLGNSKELLPLMNKRFPELGLKQSDCIETSWINTTLFFNDPPNGIKTSSINALLERPKNGSVFFKSRSDYVKKPISKQGIESIWDKMSDLHGVVMQWNPYGGRMSEILESATPFPHRAGNLFKIQYPYAWVDDSIESTNNSLNKTKDFHDFMTPFVSSYPREAFLNYRDLDIGANPSGKTDYEAGEVYGRKYFKGNFDRLVKVKTKVDPQNFLKNEQSIPTLPR